MDIGRLKWLLSNTARKLEIYQEEVAKNPLQVSEKLERIGSDLAKTIKDSNDEMKKISVKTQPNSKDIQKILQAITFFERNKKVIQETAGKLQASLFSRTLITEFQGNLKRVAEQLKRGKRVEEPEGKELL